MVLISHRGNVYGPVPELENNPQYIISATDEKYFVEIDAWKIKDKWWLGHDNPQYEIKESFLKNERFLVHAKNLEALKALIELEVHCFWHQSDKYTLTSRGWIWAYPGQPGGRYTIAVHPEKLHPGDVQKFAGVCSDYVEKFDD